MNRTTNIKCTHDKKITLTEIKLIPFIILLGVTAAAYPEEFPVDQKNCRRLAILFHSAEKWCSSSPTICFQNDVFSQAKHAGWVWGTQFAEDSFLYLRDEERGTLYSLIPKTHEKPINLLEIAESKKVLNGKETIQVATGLKLLMSKIPKNKIMRIKLWWFQSSLFGSEVIPQGSIIECTERNVIRIVFGVQGGILAVRKNCKKEPTGPDFKANDWTIERYSRTDIDEAFTLLLCDHGYEGYYSNTFQIVKSVNNFKPWLDHQKKFGPMFDNTLTMSPEIFVCDSRRLKIGKIYKMLKREGKWKYYSHSSFTFPKLTFKKTYCSKP